MIFNDESNQKVYSKRPRLYDTVVLDARRTGGAYPRGNGKLALDMEPYEARTYIFGEGVSEGATAKARTTPDMKSLNVDVHLNAYA